MIPIRGFSPLKVTAKKPLTVSLPLLLALQISALAAGLEPSQPLGGRGRAAPYNPSTRNTRTSAPSYRVPQRKSVVPPRSAQPTPLIPNDEVSRELTRQWIAEAVESYPALGEKDSPLNRSFLALYQEVKQTQPQVLSTPRWPLRLAITAAKSLKPEPAAPQIDEATPQTANQPPAPVEAESEAPEPAKPESATENVSQEQVSPSSSSGPESTEGKEKFEPRVSGEDLVKVHNQVRDLALQSKMVKVDGYTRQGSPVRGYERSPSGGLSFEDRLSAEAKGVAVALAVVFVDMGIQKVEQWWKQRERDKQSAGKALPAAQ